jgi:hypothetical protein
MSVEELQKYSIVSKYAQWNKDKQRRETWRESVDRVRGMMLGKYPQIVDEINWAYDLMEQQRVLGSQRVLQFGGKGVLAKNERAFNCTASYVDRLRFFQECFYLLLCGCGTGLSVQSHHIEHLPKFTKERRSWKERKKKTFLIPDSIEGWADSVGILLASYHEGPFYPEWQDADVVFDASLIRPEGASLSTGGKAPGPAPLLKALGLIKNLLDKCLYEGYEKLRSIDAYDIVMHMSDAVLSGGVRRSASIVLFSLTDTLMLGSKIGDWTYTNPQRARSNNSVMLLRNEISEDAFAALIKFTREYGEPGFVWVDHLDALYNPCQPSWAKILTHNGIKQIKDVNTGDSIWSKDGWTKIVKKWSTGKNKVYKYTTTAGVFYGTENHKIVSFGEKKAAKDCDAIDILTGPYSDILELDLQCVVDGLVFGDGSVHKASNNLICLFIGKDDQSYFDNEIKDFIIKHRPGINPYAYEVKTLIKYNELPHTYLRQVPERYLYGDRKTVLSFLRGVYSANGSVISNRITLKSTSLRVIEDVQTMLSSVGISSYYTINKKTKIQFSNGEYECKQSYDLNITKDRMRFAKLIGFIQPYKNDKIHDVNRIRQKETFDIVSVELISEEETFDIEVDNNSHTYWTQNCNVSNCIEAGFWSRLRLRQDSDNKLVMKDYTGPKYINEDTNSIDLSGWQMCNLCTQNGKLVTSEDIFYENCKAEAIIGTCQAGFTSFPYLGKVTEEIVKREALLGCSITGIMDNPHILLNPTVLRQGAEIVKATNVHVAKLIGINPGARDTNVKPEGTTSASLGTASGAGAHHEELYFRNVQANVLEIPYQFFKKVNPIACQKSVWNASGKDDVITFCIEAPSSAKLKKHFNAIQSLEVVKTLQENWVTPGRELKYCTQPWLQHAVSNTIQVQEHEWDDVVKYIYDNRKYFVGVTLLGATGDKDYNQAPFTAVYTPEKIEKHYGDGSRFVSGLIESALDKFRDLWQASDAVLSQWYDKAGNAVAPNDAQLSWIANAKEFATRYFNGDVKRMTYCLKDVYNWQRWVELKHKYRPVNYELMIEKENNVKATLEPACAGGMCDRAI